MDACEVAIVGAGPVGLELAVALKRRGISYVQFDAGQIGATMFWWPPGTRWFSSPERIAIAGVPLLTLDQGKATREEYLRYLRQVAEQFQLELRLYERVISIRREGDTFELRTQSMRGSHMVHARRIVLATGGTVRPRRLNIPGEDLPHVSHFMEEPHKYFRQRVLIVGGRNSAVEAALRLHQVGARVTLSYRGGEFDAKSIKYWLYPEIMHLIRTGKITAHLQSQVTSLRPGLAELSGVSRQSITVETDFVLLMVGYEADMSLCAAAGVQLDPATQAPRFDPHTMESNVPGVYLAGTAIAGTQERYKVFLENCHVHVDRIAAAITGETPPDADAPEIALPES